MNRRNPDGAAAAFAAFTAITVGVLLILAVLVSSFSPTDKLLLNAVVVALCGGALAMIARHTP